MKKCLVWGAPSHPPKQFSHSTNFKFSLSFFSPFESVNVLVNVFPLSIEFSPFQCWFSVSVLVSMMILLSPLFYNFYWCLIFLFESLIDDVEAFKWWIHTFFPEVVAAFFRWVFLLNFPAIFLFVVHFLCSKIVQFVVSLCEEMTLRRMCFFFQFLNFLHYFVLGNTRWRVCR